jgi:hypothetical protein
MESQEPNNQCLKCFKPFWNDFKTTAVPQLCNCTEENWQSKYRKLEEENGLTEIELSHKKRLLESCETALTERDQEIESLKSKMKEMYSEEDMKEFASFVSGNLFTHADAMGRYLGLDKIIDMWKSLKQSKEQ